MKRINKGSISLQNRYANYLTSTELCRQSGLSPADLMKLTEARLLVPTKMGGRYRPRLVSWAKKL